MTAPQPPKTYGDGRKTAQDIAAMSPDQQHQYIEQYMSPQDRYSFFQDNLDSKLAREPFFTRIFQQLRADAAARAQANAAGQQVIQQSTTSDTQYVTGLSASNTNYKAIDHAELQSYVDNGLNVGQVGEMSNGYHLMASTLDQISTTLNDGINKSQSEWQGNAADAARGFFTSTQQWADGNAKNMQLASQVTYDQSTAASTAKNSMPAPVPFSWADEMKSWAEAGPFGMADAVKASVQKEQQSQQAHDQAAQVMATYDNSLYSAASKQPVFAQPPKFDASSGAGPGQVSGSVGSTSASGYSGPSGAGGAGGGGGAYGAGSGGTGAGSASGVLGAGAMTGAFTGPAGRTTAQGFQPPGRYGQGSSSTGNSTSEDPLSALGGMPMGPMAGGLAGGDEAYSGGGRGGAGGGFGPGSGSGGGSASGSGSSSVGEGARTGVRGPGAVAAAAESAAAGGRGATGRPGMSGMGGAGHGGHGQGEEDEEHQRPSWLVEADPDALFGTDERTAPPVIGE